ncbi:hypothetical protein E4U43_006203 [Claviceps pusilla]|uniref:Histidine kinase group protein n=1 Tax=Claviceps pusilla TaxID=123648 RepID=A0A9P7NEW7_9HYPO|nr:hypothetical protein E4U43_006203 [Claviceps pusilla]
MAKNDEKRAPKAALGRREEDLKESTTRQQASLVPSTSSTPSASKSTKSDGSHSSTSLGGTLTISRNKHWRFISSFHGAWINLPVEILEIVANLNYSTPRPRPMDPAVVFDILKVRKNVDEATTFAVGAANDVASSTLINVNGGLPYLNPLGHGAKLSKERKLRMRELACQKLARAYRLDEIASSVASMQGTSALDNVGGLVLQRKRDNLDAKYCHFFLEKIPSRQLVSSTSLDPLTDILSSGHAQMEALRTRSTVKVFQEDFDGALQDVTEALRLSRFRDLPHSSSSSSSSPFSAAAASSATADSPPPPSSVPDTLPSRPKTEGRPKKFRNPNTVLSEDEQPTGLVQQLLFQRAAVYLSQACQLVGRSFPPADTEEQSPEGSQPRQDYQDYRKHVKLAAKRALKDYMSFLSHFDYSPNVPALFMADFHSDIAIASKQVKSSSMSYSALSQDHIVYTVPELFAAIPPPGLPEYPASASALASSPSPSPSPSPSAPAGASDKSNLPVGMTEATTPTREVVTYHPLLTEALHATLLCHSLLQTSVKELERHANMVARLVRLCQGEPIFRESRSVSRTDWVEVLRRTENWIHLGDTWEALCAPSSPSPQRKQPDASSAAAAVSISSPRNAESPASTSKSPSTQPSNGLDDGPASSQAPSFSPNTHSHDARATPGDIFADGPKDFPYSTGRATAISQWVSNAPLVTRGARRKKKTRKTGVLKREQDGRSGPPDETVLGGLVGEEQQQQQHGDTVQVVR